MLSLDIIHFLLFLNRFFLVELIDIQCQIVINCLLSSLLLSINNPVVIQTGM